MQSLKNLISNNTPLIDIRSPSEFIKGATPMSVNYPILLDSDREIVGKTYKEFGNDKAVEIGHELISGRKKNKIIDRWLKFIENNPKAKLYCARGGQRSKIAKDWINKRGVEIKIIRGGFKTLRNTCIRVLNQVVDDKKEWIIIAGKTGNHKTKLIENLRNGINLEKLANHRGSAFGANKTAQPTPINFENSLAYDYLNINDQWIALEDESRRIGRLVIPESFFRKMNSSNIVVIDQDIETRIANIYDEYVNQELIKTDPELLLKKLREQLKMITKKLGNKYYKMIDELMIVAFRKNSAQKHFEWIEILLKKYYDKMYSYQLSHKKNRCIFKGNYSEVHNFFEKKTEITY